MEAVMYTQRDKPTVRAVQRYDRIAVSRPERAQEAKSRRARLVQRLMARALSWRGDEALDDV